MATAPIHFAKFRRELGPDVKLLDEDALIPGLTLDALRRAGFTYPERMNGWYFQQLLKFAYAFSLPDDADYLIWDADTVLLRPIDLFDEQGRTWFTKADEYHEPYFESYERLLGLVAPREFSFISQHMVVKVGVLREMMARIEAHCPGDENWAWKIMRNLSPQTSNRFSEYETYGHYVKQVHPEMAAFRRLEWTRDGALESFHPRRRHLRRLAERYVFAAFESRQSFWNRFAAWRKRRFPWLG